VSKQQTEFTKEQREVLHSIRVSRVILPILIGVGVVGYLLYKQYNPEEFAKIQWTARTAFWLSMATLLLVIRHIAYAMRLRILSNREFGWRKCLELIFIWEFSSAVSPTSVGGSAVALFVLAQEKLSTAKTTTIVIYTAVLDTIFFVGTLPLLFLVFGAGIIRPGMDSLMDIGDGWGYTFLGAYFFMAVYGFLFFYGLFINPVAMKRLLVGMTRITLLRRYRHNAIELGNDFIVASREMKRQDWSYHIGGFLATATAWSCRFFLLNCVIIGLTGTVSIAFYDQMALYGRLQTMFVIMAFSPTPGGAGFAEIVFYGFLNDYIPAKSIALIIATVWRLFTYYSYLLAGVIIIPNWVRNKINQRKRKRMEQQEGEI
jgi:uncharacterized protein (TIRG00374 family)